MNQKIKKETLLLAITLGSVWGLSEVILGVGIQACSRLVSGSLMTGVALFFIAATWRMSRNLLVPVLVVGIAALFKMLDALLLSLPLMHGAIGNPIFAFVLEGFAFLLLIVLFRKSSWEKKGSRAWLGAGSALIAVGMFPLVKFATGIPACVYPNTMIPLSIFFAPVAILFSSITVPLGFRFADRIMKTMEEPGKIRISKIPLGVFSPAVMTACLVLVVLFRVIVR